MRLMTSIFYLLASFSGISHANPIIDDVSGILIDNGTVSITGSGFGVQGPTIQIYDNFEGGTLGGNVDLSAVIGSWFGYGSFIPTYDDLGYSGNLSMRVHAGEGAFFKRTIKAQFPATTEVFVSFWMQIPDGFTFPGTGIPNKLPTTATLPVVNNGCSSWKLVWWFDGDDATTDNDIGLFYVCGDLKLTGNNTFGISDVRMTFPGGDINQNDSKFRFGEWVRMTVWVKAGSPDPTGPGQSRYTYEIPTSDISIINIDTDPVFSCPHTTGCNPPYQWTHMNFTGFIGNGEPNDSLWSQTRPLFDDVYIATGPGAQSRIEICDAPLYSDCHRFGYITPNTSTDWTSTSISGVIRKGALTNLEIRNGSYIYVYDENGLVNPTGFPLCAACPRPPTNLQAE